MLKNIDVNRNPTAAQLAMLEQAVDFPVPSDDEYTELSEEELLQFKRISAEGKSTEE